MSAPSPDDSATPEDRLAELLALYDQALAAGQGPGTESEGAGRLDPAFSDRLREDQRVVALLERVWPRHNSGQDTVDQGDARATVVQSPPPQLGRFHIVRELGRGGFGVVYLAIDPLLRREVALKVPRPEALFTPELRRRFLREAQAAAGLSHPNIVPVFDSGEVGSLCFLVAAYCPGGNLAAYLRGRSRPVPARAAAALVAVLADAVGQAHARGILHRDLKPANVLLECAPDTVPGADHLGAVLRLADFGLAKFLEEESELTPRPGKGRDRPAADAQTEAGAVLGTPQYMAPEQATGRSELVGQATDVYGLGVILYELLAGRPPFQGNGREDVLGQVIGAAPPAPRTLRRGVSRDLEAICLKCLEKSPARRYATAAELAEELRRFERGLPVRARPLGAPARAWRWCRRHPAPTVAVGLAVAAAGALAAFALSTAVAVQQSRAHTALLEEQQRTEAAWTREELDRQKAEAFAARLSLEQGLSLCRQGDVEKGMLWLAHGLKVTPTGAPDLQRVFRANLAAWGHSLHRPLAFLPHREAVMGAAFRPDGRVLVTGATDWKKNDGGARFWDATTGEPLHTPRPLRGAVLAVAFSPDGQAVAAGLADGTVRLWDATTGRPRGRPLRHDGPVQAVAFGPGGRTLLTGSTDRTVRLWDTGSGNLLGRPFLHPDGVRAVAFDPGGKLLLAGGNDKAARFWDPATGQAVGPPLTHAHWVTAVAFAPDGKTALTASKDGTVRVWEAGTGRPVGPPLVHPDGVYAAAFSPDGKQILAGYGKWSEHRGGAQLWDVATASPVGQPLVHQDVVYAVAFRPHSRTVLTASADGQAWLWEVIRGGQPEQDLRQPASVRSVAFSPDGSRLVIGAWDGTARAWDAVTGQPIGPPLSRHGWVLGVAVGPDGRTALAGGADGMAVWWDVATGRPVGAPLRHPSGEWITAVAVSPDGRTVLTGSTDHTARLWSTSTGRPLGKPMPHEAAVLAVAFSPDGTAALTGSADRTARLWAVPSGEPLGPVLRHQQSVNAVAFSPNGESVLTGSTDETARLWDAATGAPRGTPFRHRARVVGVAYNPDGQTILTGSADGTAQLWDAATAAPIGPALRHPGQMRAVAFSRLGMVLTAGDRGTARLWNVPAPVGVDPGQVRVWVEALTIQTMTGAQVVRRLDPQEWTVRSRQLRETGTGPR